MIRRPTVLSFMETKLAVLLATEIHMRSLQFTTDSENGYTIMQVNPIFRPLLYGRHALCL